MILRNLLLPAHRGNIRGAVSASDCCSKIQRVWQHKALHILAPFVFPQPHLLPLTPIHHTANRSGWHEGEKEGKLISFLNLNQFNDQTHKRSPTNSWARDTEMPKYCDAGAGTGLRSSRSKHRAGRPRLGTVSDPARQEQLAVPADDSRTAGGFPSLCSLTGTASSRRGRACAALDPADVRQTDRQAPALQGEIMPKQTSFPTPPDTQPAASKHW